MDYKVVIADEDVDDAFADKVLEHLQQIIIKGKNIDVTKLVSFSVEGREATLIGATWGLTRPDVEDIEELSAEYPDLTFHFIQASSIMNAGHFENLKNYSLSVYEGGHLREIMKPEPIVWKSNQVMEFMPNPWA